MRNRWWLGPSLAGTLLVLAACGSTASPADPVAGGQTASVTGHSHAGSVAIKSMRTSKGTVLAGAGGRTLYWFAKDTMTKSNCTGSCATYWPPVIGDPTAAAGTSLPHGFGTIKRADGQVQATYDGHPLYTYRGDTAAGQVTGNGVSASGGRWWAVTPSGKRLGRQASAASSSGGGSGGW